MTRSPEHLDTDFDRERDANMHQIVYLTKRAGYEFAFSIPTTRATYRSGRRHSSRYASRNHLRGRKLS